METRAELLCRVCATPRQAGRTLCPPCHNAHRVTLRQANLPAVNTKRRNRERAKRDERRAASRCVVCAQYLPPQPESHTRCPTFQAAANNASDRHRRKKRAEQRGDSAVGDRPLHVGRHVHANVVRVLSIKFDTESHSNIRTLKHRERERRTAAAKAEGITDPVELSRRASLSLQTSALLRETIVRYHAEHDHLPPRIEARRYRGKFSLNFHFGVDAPTLAIIEHYAQTRGVSIPRTVRDLVSAATYPPAISRITA
ncbi:MAG: hypothetical protein H7Y38_14815, partial [Armatimonadetes bacterium]|nr:hypothetical protein [Armatimonadota bacterium]